MAVFTVAPGRLVVLGPKLVGGLPASRSGPSVPVNVEEDSRPGGSAGVVSSTGFPFGG